MNMRKSIIDFNEKKGFICDMDGVIYHGNQILPGVPEFIQWLHDEKKEYLFLTNNSGYTPRELNQKLARMGLDVPEEHFYASALATIDDQWAGGSHEAAVCPLFYCHKTAAIESARPVWCAACPQDSSRGIGGIGSDVILSINTKPPLEKSKKP